jgi:hypothetical protein
MGRRARAWAAIPAGGFFACAGALVAACGDGSRAASHAVADSATPDPGDAAPPEAAPAA